MTNHETAKHRMLEMIRDNGLPEPDTIHVHATTIEFLWHDKKTAVVLDLEEAA